MPYQVFFSRSYAVWLALAMIFCFQSVTAQQKQAQKPLSKDLDDSKVPLLVNKIEGYNFTIDRDKFLLQRGYDVSKIIKQLPEKERRVKGFKARFEKNSQKSNLRSLNSAVIMLQEVMDDLNDAKTILNGYYKQLNKNAIELKKILSDKDLKVTVEDSTLRTQLHDVLTEGTKLLVEQNKMLNKINVLSSRISVVSLQAKNLASDMVFLSINKKINMLAQEEAPLFKAQASDYESTYFEVVAKAFQRSARIVTIYLSGKLPEVFIGLILFFVLTFWTRSNKRRIKKLDDAESILKQVKFLQRSVLIGALFAFFTYVPFIFGNPPMSLIHTIEVLRLAALFFIIWPYLMPQAKFLWVFFSLLWLLYAIDDILLDAALGERWILFITAILLIALSVKIIFERKNIFKDIPYSPATKGLAIFTIAQLVLSILFNLTGRLTLAKIFGVSAAECLMLGISLKVFCTMVLECIYMQTEAYQSSRFSDFINYKELQYRLQRYLWVLASLVFFISFVRSITLYDFFTTLTSDFFYKVREIGNYKFTYASIAIFIFIIWLSSIISSFISFFFGHEKAAANGKRSGLNSMMLLIRLAIWTVGFLIAVAAAGIPIDKLSIMLGALGVGIGFGLQNIVNNLVSGVIIAFERPIQIGDQIEIGTKAGIVKEIGVRSSKLHSAEGSDIIVPNGDLLSQHLINWTMQDRSKRVEFTFGVAYQTDIEQAKQLILEKLSRNEGVLPIPTPMIIIQDFGEYAIGIKVLIWVADLAHASEVRTSAMIDVKNVLTEAGITLQVRPLS